MEKNSVKNNLQKLKKQLSEKVTLVAVSKTHPISSIQEAYNYGHRIFGENKIQEMVTKWEQLPKDIEWHMIGHVQTNKVKYMAPFVHLIHGVDSFKLLSEIDKQAAKNNRVINCLLQIKIAKEETKFGMTEEEAITILNQQNLKNVKIIGFMGMASFSSEDLVSQEFECLSKLFEKQKRNNPSLTVLSMGMSGDYKIALNKGSNMIRVGSAIFGNRNYSK